MEDMLGLVIRSLILSFIIGLSCQAFYETVVPRRKLRYGWLEYTTVFAFTAGFMVIAVTEIPPYILQPVRVIVVTAVVAQIYFQMRVVKNIILSIVFCGIYWLFSVLLVLLIYKTPVADYVVAFDMTEPILDICYLCLMMAFRYRYQSRIRGLTDVKWGKFGLLSIIGIAISIAVVMMSPEYSTTDYYARLIAVAGFAVAYVWGFYYMVSLLEKESQMQKLRLLHEQTQNQMHLYQSMKRRYEQQRRFSHDYKNQLNCIQGMIGSGQTKEALAYISGLTGSFQYNEMCVNTEHVVVNVMLNQKYQEACDKGTENKVIQFKMVLEEDQLVLSIRNPVKDAVQIKDNRIVTSKRDKAQHGIGLLNVDSVIRKNNGTSVLKCENGWFSFAAMIPLDEM